jgi:DNA-binding NtrC family response regulator
MPGVPDKPPTIADVDPQLEEALRAWRDWFRKRARDSPGGASSEETALSDALRALERDPQGGQRRRILYALRDARNVRSKAAEILGISERTLQRWINALDLWDEADKQAADAGFPRFPHPPRAP